MQQSGPTAAKGTLGRACALLRSRTTLPVIAALAVVVATAYGVASGQETDESYKFSRDAQQGKEIAPVPLELNGKRPRLVYLGSYLVNAQGGCNDCHTCPSYRGLNPYTVGGRGLNGPTPVNSLNYLSGGTPFQIPSGTVTSPNLTPDSSGQPGGLTYAQFKSAMQDGVHSRDSHILQIMPWPTFRNLYENDLRAIYLYLSSIPPAPSGSGQCTGSGQTK